MNTVIRLLVVASAVLPIVGLGAWLVRAERIAARRRELTERLVEVALQQDAAQERGDDAERTRLGGEFQAQLAHAGYKVRHLDVMMLPLYVLNAVEHEAGRRPWWEFGIVAVGLLCGMAAALLSL